jgi:isochorismate hydrolase
MRGKSDVNIDLNDAVLLSIDIQERGRKTWTWDNLLDCYCRAGWTPEDLNQTVAHYFDVMLPAALKVVEFMRAQRTPRIFVHWSESNPVLLDEDRPADAFKLRKSDIVLPKNERDAFASSQLQSTLRLLRRRTLIMIGGHTAGCLGDTAKSALAAGYKTMVVRDATFDACLLRLQAGLDETPYTAVIHSDDLIQTTCEVTTATN